MAFVEIPWPCRSCTATVCRYFSRLSRNLRNRDPGADGHRQTGNGRRGFPGGPTRGSGARPAPRRDSILENKKKGAQPCWRRAISGWSLCFPSFSDCASRRRSVKDLAPHSDRAPGPETREAPVPPLLFAGNSTATFVATSTAASSESFVATSIADSGSSFAVSSIADLIADSIASSSRASAGT